jgi:predicted nuclease of predicted toxin-antitoxin system
VRLLLDAHVSGPSVGGPLRQRGHDVLALSEETRYEALPDEDVLALAAIEGRILVTHDIADFPAILRSWAEGGRSHAGVILVYGIGHAEFGLIVRGIERWLGVRPRQEGWVDFPAVVDRAFATG